MDPRTVAHVLNQIGELLELHGENRYKSRAYQAAARAVLAMSERGAATRSRVAAGLAITCRERSRRCYWWYRVVPPGWSSG